MKARFNGSSFISPFLCKLGLKCDFQNWTFPPMSNNLSCKNTLPTQKLFSTIENTRFTASPILEGLDAQTDGQTDGWTDGKSPHSTGLRPLLQQRKLKFNKWENYS